jgi:hypothetical protein
MKRYGLVVSVGLAFTVLAAWAGSRYSLFLAIASPGFVISDRWLHINFWEHSGADLYVSLAIDTLIYSGVFGLILWSLSVLASRRERRISKLRHSRRA